MVQLTAIPSLVPPPGDDRPQHLGGPAELVAAVGDKLCGVLGRPIRTLRTDDKPAQSDAEPVDLLLALDGRCDNAELCARLGDPKRPIHAGIFRVLPDTIPPRAFVRRFDFETSEDTLYFVSDHIWYLGNRMATFDHRSEDTLRSYFFGNGCYVKVIEKNFDLAVMERLVDQHRNEIAFLSGRVLGPSTPRLIASGEDRHSLWIVREMIDGIALSDAILQGMAYDDRQVIADVLAELVTLEGQGLYHDDLRAHNVILHPAGRARLVDFGSVSGKRSDCMYPDNLFLVFMQFVFETTQRFELRTIPNLPTCRTAMLNVTALPNIYRRAFETFLSLPVKEWSFATLQSLLDTEAKRGPIAAVPMTAGVYLLAEKLHGAIAAHQQEIHKCRSDLATLRAHAAAVEARAKEVEAQAERIEARARNREDLLQAYANEVTTRAIASETELRAAYASNSWSITAPLRALRSAVQNAFTSRLRS